MLHMTSTNGPKHDLISYWITVVWESTSELKNVFTFTINKKMSVNKQMPHNRDRILDSKN